MKNRLEMKPIHACVSVALLAALSTAALPTVLSGQGSLNPAEAGASPADTWPT